MSNNCLVTKLKGTVDNPNLPKYGAMYFEHPTETTTAQMFAVYGNAGDAVTVSSDEITEIFDYAGNAHSLPFTLEVFSTASTYAQAFRVKQKGKFYLTSKYDINGVNLYESFKMSGTIEDFAYKNNPPSADFRLNINGSSGVTGNLSSLLNEATINHLKWLDLQDTKVEGTASDLGKFVNATILSAFRSNITGSIEDIVNSQIEGGVLTRDENNPIYSNACLYQFTFGGSKISRRGSYGLITWESASKIAIYTGAESIADCTKVTCKGYTQEEANTKWPNLDVLRIDA